MLGRAKVLIGLSLLLAFQASWLSAAEGPATEARQILDLAGVKGGLVVHLGCGDGALTSALAGQGEGYLVQGLDRDPAAVARAREKIQSLRLYGRVSADQWSGTRLPYADNLVNLIVAESPGGAAKDEILRVLAPDGVACVRQDGRWTKIAKPRPPELDEWTHDLHDATGNAVSNDKAVGPPRHVQWVGGPRWARHHDHMASMSAVVTTAGRIFYIVDEGPTSSIRLPARWFLVARDAFSGVILWKRPIESWNTHLWPLKSGPAQMPRKLVAVGQRVYATLALDAPLAALDAATGRTVRTYEGTKNAEEIICSNGVLLVQVNRAASKWPEYKQKNTFVWDSTTRANKDWAWDEAPRAIVALEAETGRALWRHQSPVAPMTLAADDAHVLFHDGEKIVCLDRKDGRPLWASAPVGRRRPMPVSFGPTLVAYQDVVLFSGGDRSMTGLSARDGKTLWTAPHPRSGHASPEDLLVVRGLAWAGDIADTKDVGVFKGRDLHTGEVKSEFAPDVDIYWFHHRCYRSKAADKYLLTSRNGIEFVDVDAKHWEPHHWVRGGCIYGIMPANGLIYAPPHSCGCYLESKLTGLNALAPESSGVKRAPASDQDRLQRGPAYGIPTSDFRLPNSDDWPTLRHDAARSGATPAAVAVDLKQVWQADLGGRLSSLTVAGQQAFVASIDVHTLYALDLASGRTAWSYTAGGRIDSPPTVVAGRVLFGSADGWVYCLAAADGRLAWRFRAATEDRRVVAYDQLESAWPVHGSVLVQGGVVYCVAGRSMFLDGGLRLVRLEAATGRKLSETVLGDRDPATGKNLQIHVKALTMPVALPDVLTSDGCRVFMRSQQFDLEGKRLEVAPKDITDQQGDDAHLFCQVGLLDDTWFHRSYWEYGKSVGGGYGQWYTTGRYAPSGRLLIFSGDTVYGYGRKPEYYCNTSVLEYELFAAAKQPDNEKIRQVIAGQRQIAARSQRRAADSSDWKLRQQFPRASLTATQFKWTSDQPSVLVRAMVLAGKTLFVAGPPDVVDERQAWRLPDDPQVQAKLALQSEALEGKLGARLWAVSAADGKAIARYRLDALPVFDGMVAAHGRLLVSTTAGQVLCLGAMRTKPLPPAEDEPQCISPEPNTPPDGWRAPEKSKDADFQRVRGCSVTESALGYRLRGNEGGDGVALKRVPKPLTQNALLKAKMRIVTTGEYLINGFLAFGEGVKDEELVKCGFRMKAHSAIIAQGSVKEGTIKSKKMDVDADETLDVTVTVDLEHQKVTLAAKGQSLEATLRRPLKAISHVGYSVDSATADFGPIEVEGR